MNTTDGILTQNIATTAGQHYTLSFWIESDNNGGTPINHFAAEWNGQTLMDVTNVPNTSYQLYTFDVIGINGNSVLEFDAYNHPDAWRLDDVTLTAVNTDTVAPGSPVIASFSTDTGAAGVVITLNGTAEANSTIKVYDNATLLGQATTDSSGTWSYTTAALSNGAHKLAATATDVAGNTSTSSEVLRVKNLLHGDHGSDYITGIGVLNVVHGDEGDDQLYFTGNQNTMFGDSETD